MRKTVSRLPRQISPKTEFVKSKGGITIDYVRKSRLEKKAIIRVCLIALVFISYDLKFLAQGFDFFYL